ncbi:hypothetical protein V2G26_016499 [Clonostachys chloroleuca]
MGYGSSQPLVGDTAISGDGLGAFAPRATCGLLNQPDQTKPPQVLVNFGLRFRRPRPSFFDFCSDNLPPSPSPRASLRRVVDPTWYTGVSGSSSLSKAPTVTTDCLGPTEDQGKVEDIVDH